MYCITEDTHTESYEVIYDPLEGLFSDDENIFDDFEEERIVDDYTASDMWSDLEAEPCDSDEEHCEADEEKGNHKGREEESEQEQDNVDQEVVNQDDRVGTNYQIQDQEVVLEGMHGTVQGQGTQPILDSDTKEQEHCKEDETVGSRNRTGRQEGANS